MFVIVPECLRIALEAKIDMQLTPELEPHRKEIYRDLLTYVNEHGVIPEFTLEAIHQEENNHEVF